MQQKLLQNCCRINYYSTMFAFFVIKIIRIRSNFRKLCLGFSLFILFCLLFTSFLKNLTVVFINTCFQYDFLIFFFLYSFLSVLIFTQRLDVKQDLVVKLCSLICSRCCFNANYLFSGIIKIYQLRGGVMKSSVLTVTVPDCPLEDSLCSYWKIDFFQLYFSEMS